MNHVNTSLVHFFLNIYSSSLWMKEINFWMRKEINALSNSSISFNSVFLDFKVVTLEAKFGSFCSAEKETKCSSEHRGNPVGVRNYSTGHISRKPILYRDSAHSSPVTRTLSTRKFCQENSTCLAPTHHLVKGHPFLRWGLRGSTL